MNILDPNFSNKITGKKVGLLGGSFNPPHAGHLAISKKALELGIEYIIWLIVPQNNLKPPYELSLQKRTELAVDLVQQEERIIVSDVEATIKTLNTYNTLVYLTSFFSNTRFIWIMGIDCLDKFHLWENYDKYTQVVDIMIFNRAGYEYLLDSSIAGQFLKPITCKKYQSGVIFIEENMSNLSSTEIRKQGKI